MASQTITLPSANYSKFSSGIGGTTVQYRFNSSRPQIDSGLTDGSERNLSLVSLVLQPSAPGFAVYVATATMSFDESASGGDGTGRDLSSAFETGGTATLTIGENSITFDMSEFADTTEPYVRRITTSWSDFDTFVSNAPSSRTAGTLVLDDGLATTTVTANAGTDKTVASGGTTTIGGSDTVENGVGSDSVSWSVVSGTTTAIGTLLSSTTAASPTFTAPTISAGGSDLTITLRKTVANNGITATDDVVITVTAPVQLPVAVAPLVSINSVAAGNEGATVSLTANISGGTYDGAVTYAWTASGGSLDDATAASPTWTRPAVTADSNFDIGLRVSVVGTGSNARNGTAAARDATQVSATVRDVAVVLPAPTAPSVTIDTVADGDEGTTVKLTATVAGGTYDTLSYAWTVDDAATGLDDQTLTSPTWTRPTVAADTDYTIGLALIAGGTGTNARSGAAASVSASDVTATVLNVVAPVSNVAPSWSPNTGSTITAVTGTAITDIQIPEADGTPTPSVYVATDLPYGLAFDEASRTISGTPLVSGSGTAYITATNTEGSTSGTDRWAVAYTITDPQNTQTILLDGTWFDKTTTRLRWQPATGSDDRPQVDSAFCPAGEDRFVHNVALLNTNFTNLALEEAASGGSVGTGDDLSSDFETRGVVTVSTPARSCSWAISDLSPADTEENYNGTPPAAADVVAFVNAYTGETNGDFPAALKLFLPPATLAAAVAPTMAIDTVSAGNEGTTARLTATIQGGTYDALDYAWTVTGGTLDNASAVSPTWTRPAVNSNTDVTISLTVTARGTGTNATNNTSDTDSDTEVTTVNNVAVLPQPEAGTVTITGDTTATNGETVTLTATLGGTQRGTLTYAWTGADITAGSDKTSLSVDVQRSGSGNADVSFVTTATGDGTTVASGTDTATDTHRVVYSAAPVTDTTPPTFTGALLNAAGNLLTIAFSEPLDGNNVPALTAFAVAATEPDNTVRQKGGSNGRIIGAAYLIDFTTPIVAQSDVTVAYTAPGSNPLQDAAGNDVASFAAQAVQTSWPEPVAPAGSRTIRAATSKEIVELPMSATTDRSSPVDWATSDVTAASVIRLFGNLASSNESAILGISDGRGHSQLISLPAAAYTATASKKSWTFANNRPQLDSEFQRTSVSIFFAGIELNSNGSARINLKTTASGNSNADLPDDFAQDDNGLFSIQRNIRGTTITVTENATPQPGTRLAVDDYSQKNASGNDIESGGLRTREYDVIYHISPEEQTSIHGRLKQFRGVPAYWTLGSRFGSEFEGYLRQHAITMGKVFSTLRLKVERL